MHIRVSPSLPQWLVALNHPNHQQLGFFHIKEAVRGHRFGKSFIVTWCYMCIFFLGLLPCKASQMVVLRESAGKFRRPAAAVRVLRVSFHMSLPKTHSLTFTNDGAEFAANLSPCVWMYNTRLQYSVALKAFPHGTAIVRHPSLGLEDATEADALALCSGVRSKPCPRCGKPAFDPATVATNRGGLCEACFLDDLNAELEEAQRRERAADDRKDKAMRKKGYKWKVAVPIIVLSSEPFIYCVL